MQMLNDRNFNLSMEILMEIRDSFKNQKKIFQVKERKKFQKRKFKM